MLTSLVFFVTSKCQKIRKINENSQYWPRKPSYILKDFRNLMKISGKMWLLIISKVSKKQGFTLSLEDTFLEIHRGVVELTPPLSLIKINPDIQSLKIISIAAWLCWFFNICISPKIKRNGPLTIEEMQDTINASKELKISIQRACRYRMITLSYN